MEPSNEDIIVTKSALGKGSGSRSEQSDHPKMPQHISSSTRQMRNQAEKMRRDKLNMHISELATIVPMVATATKRVDKTSVLRLSAAYLRMHQNLLIGVDDKPAWKPYFLHDDNLSSMLLEAVNGFLLILTTSGKVIYVSEGIEKILGHSPVDVVGHSVFTILHPDDYTLVQQQLQLDDKSQRRSFYCHFVERCLSRNDCGRYSLVHVTGHMRIISHGQDDENLGIAIQENLLVSIVRLLRTQPIMEISWMDGYPDEYITHHTLDGRIICTDHRISLIAGYLPDEVTGKSAYAYIYPKDIAISLFAHRQIFTNISGTVKILYRLCTKTKKLIYLKSHGILKYDSQTGEVQSLILINKLKSDKEGQAELERFSLRFTPLVNKREHHMDSKNSTSHPALEAKHMKWSSDPAPSGFNPSIEEEKLWTNLPTPFPLSSLPSLSDIQIETLRELCKAPLNFTQTSQLRDLAINEAESSSESVLVSDKPNTEEWSNNSSASPDSFLSQCTTPPSVVPHLSPETNIDDHQMESKVTSTTCDNDLLQTEVTIKTMNCSWENNETSPSRAKALLYTPTKRAAKKRTHQSKDDVTEIPHYHPKSLTSSAITSNYSRHNLLSETPVKRRRNRSDLLQTKPISDSSK